MPATVFHRAVALERLRTEEFDVLVIGGGVTGAGVLLDAASRGMRAALVERDDFASGTSSKSSKLVHGGLRYLQQKEFGLVHENLVERHRLLHNAPHLVEPLAFLIPLFGKGGVVDQTVVRAYSVALFMYDAAGGWKIGKRHRKITADELAVHLPTLRRDRLVAGFVYYDARTDDARLTLTIARTAVLSHGAVACNHAVVTDLLRDAGGDVCGARVDAGEAAGPIEVRARAVVNATGIWADEIRSLESGKDPSSIRPAKGIHLTVARETLPCDLAAVIPVPKDRRSIFVIPWGEHTYLGTTDTDYDGPIDDPKVDEADIDYLLGAINQAVIEPIGREDITGSWAGLRPLLARAPGRSRAPSARTADLSRRHQVIVSDGGLVTITGGKLTTYRKMAEDAVDALSPRLGRIRPCATKRLRLRGAEGLARPVEAGSKAPDAATLAHLQARYGTDTGAVLGLIDSRPDLGQRIVTGLPYLRAEVVFAARYEMATCVADVLARRTRAVLLDGKAAVAAAPIVAGLLGDELGWDDQRRAEEMLLAADLDRHRPGSGLPEEARAMTEPTPPIEWGCEPGDLRDVFAPTVSLDDALLDRLRATGAAVGTTDAERAEAARDWWPLAQRWALRGRAPARPAAVVRPDSTPQVAAVLELADSEAIPVTATAGRSGVCGSAVPVFGGIALDCCGLSGVADIDDATLHVTVGAGEFGPDLERCLSAEGLTVGHWPQSMELATVGGWVACRGAGQYSTRYGKIEDIVAGLEVVLASGRTVRTGSLAGAGPRSATGPDLTQLFVGSEGTLGIITSVVLRAHPVAEHERRSAWEFPSFEAGLEALRLTLRAGATPAVVRLYDERESERNFERGDTNVLVALDEGHEAVVETAMGILAAACERTGGVEVAAEHDLVGTWLGHRNDVSALAGLTRAGIVVDTVEVSAGWARLPALYRDAVSALSGVDGCLAASAHESHAYLDGACLYFTFAGRGADPHDDEWAAGFYERAWSAVMSVTRHHGGSISHHHGIGIVRSPYLASALGEGFEVLQSVKAALDPNGILNPGKLGLPSRFGSLADQPVSGLR